MSQNSKNLFFDCDFPDPLTKEELFEEFKKYRDGDEKAKEKIAFHNIKLVFTRLNKRFFNTVYDYDELVSIGLFGLAKAINTFDMTMGIEFSSYAVRCIDNEILMHFRKDKKHLSNVSIDIPIGTDKNGKDLVVEDTLYDDEYDITSFYEKEELYKAIRLIIEDLSEKERIVVKMYFGFIDDKKYNQKAIAEKLNCSRSYIGTILRKALEKIKIKLQKSEFIEVRGYSSTSNSVASDDDIITKGKISSGNSEITSQESIENIKIFNYTNYIKKLMQGGEFMSQNSKDLFLDCNLPNPLTKEELLEEFKKYRDGDEDAKEKIAFHNIKLVINQVQKKFFNTPYDADELVSVGLFGLVKAIDTFDTSKEVEFSSYAVRCIDNEILTHMRKAEKHLGNVSIDVPIGTDRDGKDLVVEDTLYDDEYDITSFYEKEELYKAIRLVIEELPEKENKVIKLYFGFIDDKKYNQREIAEKLNCSQSYASRIIKKALKKIEIKLQESEFIEVKDYSSTNKSVAGRHDIPAKSETSLVTKEEISCKNELEPLEKEEAREEKTFDVVNSTKNNNEIIDEESSDKTMNIAAKTKGSKDEAETVDMTGEDEPLEIMTKAENPDSVSKKEAHSCVSNSKKIETMDSIHSSLMGKLSIAEEVIVYLSIIGVKSNSADNKRFTPDEIADFFQMEKAEVIKIMKKALQLYKDEFNKYVDDAVSTLEMELKVLKKK